jgi:acyl-CoA thioester hydrolase
MSQPFTHRIRVRYAECDPQGVVFNAHYYAYYDLLITELWREAAGGYAAMLETGVDLSVIESRARFFAPGRFDDELDLIGRVTRLGNTAMSTAIDIVKADGTLLVRGDIHHVFIDPLTYSKRPIPDDIRSGLERFLVVEEAEAPA